MDHGVRGRVEFWDVKGGVCENADSILRGLGAWKSAFLRSSQLMLTLPVLHDLTSLLWGCYLLQRSTHSKRASLKGLTSEQSSGSRNCPGETVAKGERSRWREKPVPKPGKGRGTWTRGAGGGGEDAMQEVEGRLLEREGAGPRGVLKSKSPLTNCLRVFQNVFAHPFPRKLQAEGLCLLIVSSLFLSSPSATTFTPSLKFAKALPYIDFI